MFLTMADSNNRTQPATFNEFIRKWKKRPHPPVFNGLGPYEDKNNDFLCPICFEMISEAHMTKCGHTFCFKCITTSLEYNKRCPKCGFVIESVDEIYPNFLLNELISKCQRKDSDKRIKSANSDAVDLSELEHFLSSEKANLTIEEINSMLEILARKKQQLEANCRETQILLMKEFLQKVRLHKQEELRRLTQQVHVIDHDSLIVQEMLKDHQKANKSHSSLPSCSNNIKPDPSTSQNCGDNECSSNMPKQDGFNGSKYGNNIHSSPSLAARRKRLHEHFNDLEQSYFLLRSKDLMFSTSAPRHCFLSSGELSRSGFDDFNESLSKFTRFSSVRPLASLHYANDHFNSSNIVSSIEFDKDNEFFAIAGVTKKIKIYDYGSVIRDSIDMHYPMNEMLCNSKISCISWSSYHKSMLASSDYEGTVTLWDAFTGGKVKTYQEHEKRCWSVDFNKIDTKLIASGSDDAKVKLWSTTLDHSVTSLEAKANVCCVKFNPESRFHLAFGSADHCVHYYDLRNTKEALEVFKGHKKAVSYVKFLNKAEVVSASTDSQLKLWNVNQSNCLRSFKGHLNEKNFVGLATDGDFVACGSENNALYIYYKGLSTQVLTFRFDTVKSILEKDKKEEDSNEFVSAVCWRMGSNVVVAANSQGNIKVLELV
ncbi:E3 ubiquitin-protein ligase COP1-like isoform X2 [Uloborus diversus]|uniref:E3 ubiquitin-protein ligase COP1-like isoform X2 n=1 Tax=Uloborus diversus TaxID=327109 RepID=UPI00240A265A|nr:E3 ubiquitin-protein ligase COP1-like isoform X2 [Uloborus diversus]